MPRSSLAAEFEGLTGANKVRVSAEGFLVRGVELAPSTLEVKGVGDAPETVSGADGVRAVGGVGGVT
jgi:hypothetical protein